jgi:hypothetical protein
MSFIVQRNVPVCCISNVKAFAGCVRKCQPLAKPWLILVKVENQCIVNSYQKRAQLFSKEFLARVFIVTFYDL